METIEPVWIIFYQIDYRTEVVQRPYDSKPAHEPVVSTQKTFSVTIPPGEIATVLSVGDPAVMRRWSLKTDVPLTEHRGLDLRVRYDGRPSYAVAATLGDFFSPFWSVALDTDEKTGTRTSYLLMPFARSVEIRLENRTRHPVAVEASCEIEMLADWTGDRGYFHALGQMTAPSTGYRQHQVAYVRGRGHWFLPIKCSLSGFFERAANFSPTYAMRHA